MNAGVLLLLACGMALALLSACGTTSFREMDENGLSAFQMRIERDAKAAVDRGDLARALRDYRILETLAPHDSTVLARIEGLQYRIRQRAALYQVEAQRLLKAGKAGEARRRLLKSLSLVPDDRRILALLAKLESDRARADLTRQGARTLAPAYRDGVDLGRTLAPPAPEAGRDAGPDVSPGYSEQAALLNARPRSPVERQRLIGQLITLGDRLFARGQAEDALRCLNRAEQLGRAFSGMADSVKTLKTVYASKLYGRAVAARRDDPRRATRLFRLTLRFDPGFAKARLQLKRLQGQ